MKHLTLSKSPQGSNVMCTSHNPLLVIYISNFYELPPDLPGILCHASNLKGKHRKSRLRNCSMQMAWEQLHHLDQIYNHQPPLSLLHTKDIDSLSMSTKRRPYHSVRKTVIQFNSISELEINKSNKSINSHI